MDWIAVGSLVAGIAAVIIAYLQLRKKPAPVASPDKLRSEPAEIRYSFSTIEGSLPDELVAPLRTSEFNPALRPLERALRKIGATTIVLKNKSGVTVTDVRLRLTLIGDVYSIAVTDTTRLAKESVHIERADRSIRICIEELPKEEVIRISLFREGGYAALDMKSERANVILKDEAWIR